MSCCLKELAHCDMIYKSSEPYDSAYGKGEQQKNMRTTRHVLETSQKCSPSAKHHTNKILANVQK